MDYPLAIKKLIEYFSLLPSVGPKTAERYVLFLLKKSPEDLQGFAQAIAELKEKTIFCRICHALAEKDQCSICNNKQRNNGQLCVVANTQDMISIEATGQYRGKYHILGGLIDTVENIRPEQLKIKSLLGKFKKDSIKEAILALAPTLEGETTAMYLTKAIKPLGITVSRLAKGLPSGMSLEYTDEMTLANALKYRNKI